jgi:hypothetical protein
MGRVWDEFITGRYCPNQSMRLRDPELEQRPGQRQPAIKSANAAVRRDSRAPLSVLATRS